VVLTSTITLLPLKGFPWPCAGTMLSPTTWSRSGAWQANQPQPGTPRARRAAHPDPRSYGDAFFRSK
jgi:hypothetical protein